MVYIYRFFVYSMIIISGKEKQIHKFVFVAGFMRVRLGDVCEKGSSNLKQSDVIDKNGEYEIYGASGLIGKVDFFHQEKTYIAVVKDGAGIGRTMLLPEKTSVIGTMQYILPNEKVIPKYLYYVIRYMHLEKYFTGATIPHIYFKDYKREEFNLCNLSEQEKIVSTLSKIEKIITHRKQQFEKLDLLVKGRFVEMFGDPVSNPMGWVTKPLLSIGKCKNGMNFHYDDSGIEVHCLGVGNFKNLSIIDNTTILPKISLNEMPSDEYLLKNDDIVFVRSNGNKELVGRSLAIYPNNIPTTFSGFCIRFRKNDNSIIVPYLLRVLKTESIRKKMTGRGANIQNLNQQILSTLEIPIPPFNLQTQFADFVKQVDKSRTAIQNELKKTQMLFDSLMQGYFG